MNTSTLKTTYFIGLDLGQMSDYTALSVVAKVKRWTGSGPPPGSRDYEQMTQYERACYSRGTWELVEYQVRHLERFRLGTPYPRIVERVREIQASPTLKDQPAGRDRPVYVVADATGVGRPVIDLMKARGVKDLYAITITAGNTVNRGWKEYHAPKRDLVSVLQVLLQNEKLRIAEALPEAAVLRAELQNFRVKISLETGHDSYEAWREREHDDLVLSLALPCWLAETNEPADWSEGYPIVKN